MAGGEVWYVAYGSNLSSERFQRYLDRHARNVGLEALAPGARRPTELPYRLFFAHESSLWSGGVAFLDPQGHGPTRGVAWLVPRDAFVGVLAMENGRSSLELEDDAFALRPGETRHVADGWYGLLLGCESPDRRPALTFTTAASPLPSENSPSDLYVDTIVNGLVAEHGLSAPEARAYLAGFLPA